MTAPALTTRRTAPKEQRLQELIEATMETIAERGLAGTTLAVVTGRAGLSHGLANHHFRSKENLLTATLGQLAEELRAVWVGSQSDDSLSTAEKLRAVVEGMFDPVVCTPTKIAVWFAFFGDAHYRGVYSAMAGDFDAERLDVIADLCRTLAEQEGRRDVDARGIARSVEALADGLWLSILLRPNPLSHVEAVDRIIDLLALQFPGHFDPAARGRAQPACAV